MQLQALPPELVLSLSNGLYDQDFHSAICKYYLRNDMYSHHSRQFFMQSPFLYEKSRTAFSYFEFQLILLY